MNPSNLKDMVKAAFSIHRFDGITKWSRESINGLIRPRGFHQNSLNDPEIIQMFTELEQEGVVMLLGDGDDFLVVLDKK